MIDMLCAKARLIRALPDETEYHPGLALTSIEYHDYPECRKLTIVFPMWNAGPKSNRFLCRKLRKQGYSLLFYNQHPLILNSDGKKVEASFDHIVNEAVQDINSRNLTDRYDEIDLLGISLGHIGLFRVAERLDHFDAVTMIVPGSELATPFWEGARTRKLSETYRERDVSLEELRKAWANLAPINHLDALKGHKITVELATKDLFIPYSSGRELVDAMLKKGYKSEVSERNVGHVAAIIGYILSNR